MLPGAAALAGGVRLPRCGSTQPPWPATRGRLVCAACRHQSSVTAGTVLNKTHTPLVVWFDAAWQLTMAKNDMSAVTLQRMLP